MFLLSSLTFSGGILLLHALQTDAAVSPAAAPPDLPPVPLSYEAGFWYAPFTAGSQTFQVALDTGSYAAVISKGLWKSRSAKDTHTGQFLAYNGGNENGTLFLSETIEFWKDKAAFGEFKLSNFTVGNVTQGDSLDKGGILGFLPAVSEIDPNDPTASSGESFFGRLCASGEVKPCAFGVAYGMNDIGKFYFGNSGRKFAKTVTASVGVQTKDSWFIDNRTAADGPAVVVKGKTSIPIIAGFDSGSPLIIAPRSEVIPLFQTLGWQLINQSQTNDGVTFQYTFASYPCGDPSAGSVGFKLSPSSPALYLDARANVLSRDSKTNRCTARIMGTSTAEGQGWSIGQNWWRGRLVQHDVEKKTIEIADLL